MLVGENVVPTRVAELTFSTPQKADRCYDWIYGFKLAPLVDNMPEKQEANNHITFWLKMCGESLTSLAGQPRIEEHDAWRLRSMNLQFRKELGNISGSQAQDRSTHLHRVGN